MNNAPVSKTRLLGIDFGFARIGIALSDETHLIASAIKTIASNKKLSLAAKSVADEVKNLETEKKCQIKEIVVGMPLKMSGTIGIQADEVTAFKMELEALVTCPVILWDERLTTVQAERMLKSTGMSRKKRSKVVDNVAATIILQSYLDYKRGPFS